MSYTAEVFISHLVLNTMVKIWKKKFPDAYSQIFFCILIQISPKFVPKGQIINKPALIKVMAWHWTSDKSNLNQWCPSSLIYIYLTKSQGYVDHIYKVKPV